VHQRKRSGKPVNTHVQEAADSRSEEKDEYLNHYRLPRKTCKPPGSASHEDPGRRFRETLSGPEPSVRMGTVVVIKGLLITPYHNRFSGTTIGADAENQDFCCHQKGVFYIILFVFTCRERLWFSLACVLGLFFPLKGRPRWLN